MRPTSKQPGLMAGLFLLFLSLVYVWCATAGTWRQWLNFSNDYALLATGFLHGKLSLPVPPPPALLALADPYDRAARRAPAVHDYPVSIHDLVLYKRRFYLAWGPVPALIDSAAALIQGRRDLDWGDQYLAVVFVLGTMALTTWLLLQIHRRLFPEQPDWTVLPALASLGLGTPLLWMVARGAVYEASIAGGQFFLLAGFCAAWIGLSGDRPLARWIALASACWILSVGSRISLPPAVAIVALTTALHLLRRRQSPGAPLTALIASLLIGTALIGFYNFARFHSYTEFGVRFQLAGEDQSRPLVSGFISPRHLIPNFLIYLLTPPAWLNSFPFLHAAAADSWFGGWTRPASFRGEPVVGLLWSQPFLCVMVPLLFCRPDQIDRLDPDQSLQKWLIWSAGLCGLLAIVPALTMDFSTMRYLADMVPCLTIVAALGFWQAMRRLALRPKSARVVVAAVCCLVLAQTLVSILLVLDVRPTVIQNLGRVSQNSPE
jgi:hypothetical protein